MCGIHLGNSCSLLSVLNVFVLRPIGYFVAPLFLLELCRPTYGRGNESSTPAVLKDVSDYAVTLRGYIVEEPEAGWRRLIEMLLQRVVWLGARGVVADGHVADPQKPVS